MANTLRTYITKQDDMWDIIAQNKLGSTKFTGKLIAANEKYARVYKFSAGITLNIPEVSALESSVAPPWRS